MALSLLDRIKQTLTGVGNTIGQDVQNIGNTIQNLPSPIKALSPVTLLPDALSSAVNYVKKNNLPAQFNNAQNSFVQRTGRPISDFPKSKEYQDLVQNFAASAALIMSAAPKADLTQPTLFPEKPIIQDANVVTPPKELPGVTSNTIAPVENSAKSTLSLFDKPGGSLPPVPPDVPPVNPDAFKAGDIFKPKGVVQKTTEALFGDKSLQGSKGIIANSGPAGQEIVNLLDKADQIASHSGGQAVARMQDAIKNLKGEELTSFADVAEGKIPPVSQAQQTAVETWKTLASDVATKAKATGIDMGNITNYFPHQTTPLSPTEEKAFAQTLVDQGKFKTVAEAQQAMAKETSSLGRTAPRRFGNLELPRQTNLPYNKSPNVLFDYLKNAHGRIADVTHFGPNDENLYKLAQAAGTQGGDTGQISSYLDQILGKNQTSSGLGSKLKSIQSVTKLNPMTSMTNLTQNLSTMLRTDVPTVVKTIGNIISDPTSAFANATKVGEISPDMAKQLEDYAGGSSVVSKWIRLIGMNGTEKFNRVVAVNSGMEYAAKLAADGGDSALRELERLGIQPNDIVNGGLSEEKLLEAGRRLSRTTQFATKPGELPYAWKTEAGKVITQFKSFAYKQTGFLKGEVGRVGGEAAKGNIKPLINALTVFGIAAPIAGEIVNDFKSLITNKKRQDVGNLTQRYVNNILGATSFGLIDNLGALTGQYGESGIIGAVGGPTVSDASKVVTAVSDASKGLNNYDKNKSLLENVDPNNTTQRAVLGKIPAVGQTISNTLVPNSYIDNFAGKNNGLNTTDNATYNNMKAIDPTAAETFKRNNQQSAKPQTGGNFLSSLFGGGQSFDWNSVPTSKKGKTAYNTQVDTALESGANVPDKALNQRFFNGKTYDQGNNGDKETIMKSALTVSNDQYLTPEQKSSILNSAGVTQDNLDYYKLASQNETDKISQFMQFVDSSQMSHPDLLNILALNKRRVAGQYITTPALVDELYQNNYISKDDKALLTAIKYDSVYNKFFMDKGYTGGGMTAAQKRAYINSVNSIFKSKKKASASKKTMSLPKTPTTQTLSPLTK